MGRRRFMQMAVLASFCLLAIGCAKDAAKQGSSTTGLLTVRTASIEFCSG